MGIVSMKQLLEAGVHFGHPTRRWNPKMAPYLFGKRNDIYIINLQKTQECLDKMFRFVKDLARDSRIVLFVGTKKQAKESVEEAAKACGMPYVTRRWLGGTLTNYNVVYQRAVRLKEMDSLEAAGYPSTSPKQLKTLKKEKDRLEKVVGGIREMTRLPDAIFVVDLHKEGNAVKEARKMNIPVIAIVDSNCDPDAANYIVPGNDDAIRSIRLIANIVSQAVVAGREAMEPVPGTEAAEEPVDLPAEAAKETEEEKAASSAPSKEEAPGGAPEEGVKEVERV